MQSDVQKIYNLKKDKKNLAKCRLKGCSFVMLVKAQMLS